jgi:hypothetical protein
MRCLRCTFFIALLLAAGPAAYAEKRVALVIGNSAYQYTAELDNPKNDAADMATVLRKHGFEVIEGLDLGKAAFDRKVGDFASALRGADAGVFFYAGHGLQVGGQNYLVPIDAKAEEEVRLDLEMVRVEVVHRIMERQTETNVLFLDACRDNPLARNLARSLGTRSAEVGRGLARVDAGVGTLISFATQPGSMALDGAGRNSPYTGALVKRLAISKEDLSTILIDVRNDVMRATRNKQVPWEHVALRARFYFGPPAPGAAPTPPTSEAALEWARLDKASVVELETFVRRHSTSAEAAYARAYLEELKKKRVVVAAPPKALPPGVRGWLGINVNSVDAQSAARLLLRSPRGAVIVELSPGGPAAVAGLKVDDVVVSINGADIGDARAFATTVAAFAPDASLRIKIWRNGKEQVVSATLGVPPTSLGHK